MPPTRADYAKINIACKELCLDKYQLIGDRYNLKSSKDLAFHQLNELYQHFSSLGWKVKRPKKNKTSPKYEDNQLRKVVAVWITLYKKGVVKNKSDKALQAYVKRVTGVYNLKWCKPYQVSRVIQTLKKWAAREGVDVY